MSVRVAGPDTERVATASRLLLGRDRELAELYALVDGIDEHGGALVVRGEAGIGKSALLAAASERALDRGVTVMSTTGALSEAQLAFAGLHQLLLPLLGRVDLLPDPQRRALETAFGIAEGDAPNLFLIGLATLGLVTERAAETPLLFVVEDAHWLDRPSSEVLEFVARRVESDPAVLLFAVREGVASCFDDTDLRELHLSGLDQDASNALLDLAAVPLPADLKRRILEEAAGNPLALIELPPAAAELGTRAARSGPLPLTARLEQTFALRLTSFADDPDVQIPRVFWETTTSQVITLERIQGMKVSDVDALTAAGIDRHELAERATRVTAKMVFDDGFFHGDPHPGNFFIEPSGRIGLIDFGIVGTLDDGLRDELGKVLIGVIRKDPNRLAGSLIALGATTGQVDRARLRGDLAELMDRYSERALGEISVGAAIGEAMDIARRHQLRLPRNLALLAKVIVMGEGLTAELDPKFQIADVLAPYARRQLLAQLSPAALARRVEQVSVDIAELAVDFPGQLHRLLEVLGDGGLELHLRAGELEPLLERTERLGNRIAASVIVAAAINAATELAATGRVRRSDWRRPLPVLLGAVGGYMAMRRALPAAASRAITLAGSRPL